MSNSPSIVKFNNQDFKFFGASNCSISQILANSGAFYEMEFLTAVSKLIKTGDWAIDVGAHIGNHAIFFAKVLGLRVLAFEANPETFKKLKANIAANEATSDIAAQNLAISDKEDIVSLTPIESGDIGTYSVAREAGPVSVRCRSKPLDFFKNYLSTRVPTFIKFDIEGAEALALDGAKEIISLHRPIIATEIINSEELNAVSTRLLALGYYPEGVYNATPTVIWLPNSEENRVTESTIAQMMNLLKYAITSATESQALRERAIRSEAREAALITTNEISESKD